MSEVYNELGAAIKRRDHATQMLKRWQTVLDNAEEEIRKLSGELASASQATGAVFEQMAAQEPTFEQA